MSKRLFGKCMINKLLAALVLSCWILVAGVIGKTSEVEEDEFIWLHI